MKLEWLGGLVIVLLLACAVGFVHEVGKLNGASEVQEKWDKEKEDTAAEVGKLKTELARKEAEHQLLSEQNSNELARTQKEHEQAMADLLADYTGRLLNITKRAEVYERLSRGSATERDRLVQHTAELDRTLEEGRHLVGELRQTLGQCEVTVGVLGTQILLDRNLLK